MDVAHHFQVCGCHSGAEGLLLGNVVLEVLFYFKELLELVELR